MKRARTRTINEYHHWRRGESGQGLTEYAILLSLVALAVIGVVMLASQGVNTAFNGAKDSVGGGGADFTPLPGGTLAPFGALPTPQPIPTATPIPPTSTPAPPTNTPVPPTTIAPATQTAWAYATQTASAGKVTATAGAYATQTSIANITATANAATTGAAMRYVVDQLGWQNSADGFCGNGVVVQSGNNGLTTVVLIGQPGQYVCFRIDTYVAGNTSPAAKARIVAADATGSSTAVANLGFLISFSKDFSNATNVVNGIYHYTDVIPVYARARIPDDVCSTNKGKVNIGVTSQGTDSGIGNADAVTLSFVCSATPTPTKPPSTPAPTNTPAPTPTPNQGTS